MNIQPLSFADSYKLSHHGFEAKGTEYTYSNLTPRTGKYFPIPADVFDGKSVFFGLQYLIKGVLINQFNQNFFNISKEIAIKRFKRRCDTHLGKDKVKMDRFEKLYDLGYLPISIKSLPEGSLVPFKVPYLTIINTHPEFAWLTNYLETLISATIWKMCYSATLIKEYKKIINKYADETVGNREHTNFSLHGFELRGMSGIEDGARTGAGLLLHSWGTDNIPAIEFLEEYYLANAEKEIIGLSVPASEHAVTSLGTSVGNEFDFFEKAITEYYPDGIVSLVSDTYDYFTVITEFANRLKHKILTRATNEFGLSRVVFRPDSGDQVEIICGNPNALSGSPEYKGTIECLWEIFGGTISEKGYKTLDSHVGCILGDGCDYRVISGVLEGLKKKGFASNNILFGIGSYSMNTASRDSLGIAQKATWAQVNGVGYELFKDPKTDSGMKKSARGLLRVDKVDGEYILKDRCTPEEEAGGELKEVFRDGKLLIETSLSEIRERLSNS